MGVADGALYRFTPDLRRKPGLPVGREMPILHCLADCNGDGTLDVVGTAGTELFVATFGPDMEMHLGRTSMTPVPYALVPCETDGDGDMEMVALHRAPGGRGYEGRIIELAPLTVASPDETSRRSLLDLGGARALSLSPRAALLVAREDDEVRIVDAVMAETLLTWPDAPDDIGVTWSPSGDAVAAWVPGGAARMASAPFDAWQEAVLDAEAVTLGDAGEVLYLARDGDLFQHDPVTGRSRPVAAANTDAVETDPLLSPDGRLLAFLREGGGGDPLERRRRDVCVLDLDSRATRLLTSDRAVLEMLADDGRTSPVPFARADASIAPRALELAWMPDSLTLYVAGAVYGTSGTGMDEFAYWGGPTAEDDLLVTRRQVWTVDAHGGGLTRARLPALHAMGRPMPSPRGNWLAVLVDPTGYFQREPADPMARPEPSANLAIASLAQSGSVTLAEGGVDAFAWVDGLETTIRYASGGVLWELDLAVPQVREAPALSAGERRLLILETVGVTALSLIALTVLGVVAYRHGSEWLRMVRLVRRGVKLGFEPQILREMLSTMEELSGIAHSLKNAATVLPMGPGGTATPEDVLACIDQDGLPSLTRMAGMLRDRAGTVAARREEWDRNLSGFTGYVRGELRAAWDAAVACVPRCEAIVARLSAVAASDDPDLAEAADLLEQLRARLEPGTGLMESLDRGLRPFLLGSILTEARERVRGRAEGLGIDLSAVPVEAHRVRVCGDPAPLVDVVHTLLTNSLEAVVERARREGEDYRGEIDLQVERNDLLTMRVMDNGCGIEPSLLAQLNDHTGVSTKSPARGTGLRAAATILQRYPGSGLRLHSDGHDEGATAELRLGKA
jgi:signal transduction histidine kinase